jgi:uncharacterized membrane protein
MKHKRFFFVLLMLIGGGLFFMSQFVFISGEMKAYSGLSIGLGAACSGLGIGWFIQSMVVSAKQFEQIERQKRIDVNDERNTRIRERTGYMVTRVMNYVLSVFIVLITLLGANRTIIFLAVGMLVIELGLVIYFSNRYAKMM